MGFRVWLAEKLNPAQKVIVDDYGESTGGSNKTISIRKAYDSIVPVQRGVNFIVDCAAEIKFDIGKKINTLSVVPADIRINKLDRLINYQPNIYQDRSQFLRDVFLDFLLTGDIILYWDGAFLYHLPSQNVVIHSNKTTFIDHFEYGDVKFNPQEIIWIKENSLNVFRGQSRLKSALNDIDIMHHMSEYYGNFFKNGTLPGLVLSTPNTLSNTYKEKMLTYWGQNYSVAKGGRKPMILDSDFKLDSLGTSDLRELDFKESANALEDKIYRALGIPPVLINSGNNANISPNLKVFYLSTVVPLVKKLMSGFERFFGYDLSIVKQNIAALKPELREEANYYTSLVNSGVISRNEAREQLRYQPSDEEFADELILPANIAGSALDSTEGGRPENEDKEDDESKQDSQDNK